MQIEQYQRRETPIGSVGGVITQRTDSYAELGRLGKVITDIGFAMEEQRLNAQYNDEMTASQLEWETRSLEHEEKLDPNNTDQWEAETDTFQKQAADEILSKIKHGKARDDASAWMEQRKLYQKKVVSTLRTQTDFRNFSANYRNNRPLAIENAAKQPTAAQYDNARLDWLRSQYGLELKDPTKPIDMDNLQTIEGQPRSPLFPTEELQRSEAAAYLADAAEAREKQLTADQYRTAMTMAGTDPEGTLALFEKAIESGKTPPGYGLLDAGHWRAIKNIAKGTISERKMQVEEVEQSQIEAVHNLAAKGAPYAEVVMKIDQSDALSGQQKTQLLKIYNDAVAARAKTGQNPYETTQNWTVYNKDRDLVLKGELDLKTVNEHTGPGGYSDKDSNRLKEMIRDGGTAKDFEDSDVAKDLKSLVNSLGISEPQKFVLTSKGYGLLSEAIDAEKTPFDLTQKRMKVLDIFNMLQKEADELELEQISPEEILTPKQKQTIEAESLGRELDKAVAENRAYRRELAKTKRQKGLGYFGELKRPDGRISTEISIGVKIDGKETEIPSLVPTLTREEIDYLLADNKPTPEIVKKATLHAKQRIAEGKSPFAQIGEQVALAVKGTEITQPKTQAEFDALPKGTRYRRSDGTIWIKR